MVPPLLRAGTRAPYPGLAAGTLAGVRAGGDFLLAVPAASGEPLFGAGMGASCGRRGGIPAGEGPGDLCAVEERRGVGPGPSGVLWLLCGEGGEL